LNCTILVLSTWIPIIWNTNYIIHRLGIPSSIEAKINHSIQNIFQSLFLPKFFSNSIFCAIMIDKISGCQLHLTLVNYNCSYWLVKSTNHMLRLFYYIIYSSNVILEYLTQISSRVSRHLQLLKTNFLILHLYKLYWLHILKEDLEGLECSQKIVRCAITNTRN